MKKLILIMGLLVAAVATENKVQAQSNLCTPFYVNAYVSKFQEGSSWELSCNYGDTSITVYEYRNGGWYYLGSGYFSTTGSRVYVPWSSFPLRAYLLRNRCPKTVYF